MGNRAVIAFKDKHISKEHSPAIYLHWNGGRDSIEAFLKASSIIGIRWGDATYACARMAQIIGNWMGGSLSLGVSTYANLDTDNGDNGVFWVENAEIVDREFVRYPERNTHNLDVFVAEIMRANKHIYPDAFDAYEQSCTKVLDSNVVEEIAQATKLNDHGTALAILALKVGTDFIIEELSKINSLELEYGHIDSDMITERNFYRKKLLQLAKEKFDNFDDIYQAF